jgi:hypothetical protein
MIKQSKKSKILNHLKTYRSITSWEAIGKYRATRLSAIIKDLRNEGYHIDTIMQSNGETRYAMYVLVDDDGPDVQ